MRSRVQIFLPAFLPSRARGITPTKLELGDSEVAEAYMDAKFGGEGADMVEIVGGW